MPRIRPTEHKAVMRLLDQPADSVHELATDVIQTIDTLRSQRKDWVALVIDPGVCVHVHGPYVSKAAALKDIGQNVTAASKGASVLVLPLLTDVDEGLELWDRPETQ